MSMAESDKSVRVGMVVVAHGLLADGLREVLEHVVGPQEQTATVCIGPEDDMEQRRDDIVRSINEVDRGAGVIVFTDMFGGTPSNLAISIMERDRVEVIAGVNLPMLVRFASLGKHECLEDVVREVTDAGQKYIKVASEVLREPS